MEDKTPADNPQPAPVAPAPAPAPSKPASDHSSQIRAAAQAALDSQRNPQPKPVDKPVEEPKKEGEVKDFPRLTKSPEPPKEKPKAFDPANLPPELADTYKLMQADYTRKTQELAEGRKALLDEREKFLERIAQTYQPKEDAETVTDPREQIRQLRDEGRHEEADQLLIELTNRAAEERIRPIEQAARTAEMTAIWRDTVSQVLSEDKIVKPYEKEVGTIFDGQNPIMAEIRTEALKSPERIKTWIPAIFHFLAVEQHAMRLEQTFDARVKEEVERQVSALKQHASKLPGRLVESGGESKAPSGPLAKTVREAASLAYRQLTEGG
jgi:hypothetical protein